VSDLSIEVADSRAISMSTLRGIADLCTEAYREDFTGAFGLLGPGVHVIARADGRIVSHAMWVVRELHAGTRPPFRTAYVEAVATRPLLQRRGFATEVLRRLAREIRDYDLGALSPSDDRYYARLGWESWRGPLSIRTGAGLEATPDETVMILRTGRTPPDLDLDEPLSAEWRAGELW
jgi:aminoglycoside 2'-N-acetyltransferase I